MIADIDLIKISFEQKKEIILKILKILLFKYKKEANLVSIRIDA